MPFNPWGGDGSNTAGAINDPFTLTGTTIYSISDSMRLLAGNCHREADTQDCTAELWYRETGGTDWISWPMGPLLDAKDGPRIKRGFQQVTTCELTFPNPRGYLTPRNCESPYNYDADGNYRALIDEGREVLLRGGIRCYSNLIAGITATASASPGTGTLAGLTNGAIDGGNVRWTPGASASVTLTWDLGSQQMVHHLALRLRSLAGTTGLPATVQAKLSTDNSTWRSWPARSVGGDGDGTGGNHVEVVSPGADVDLFLTDLHETARYVRLVLVTQAGSVGALPVQLRQVACYGGPTAYYLGANQFRGYLGDTGDFANFQPINVVATGVLKRAGDNRHLAHTTAFTNLGAGQIIYTLLTTQTYWAGTGTAYDAPYGSSDLAWAEGEDPTGLLMPQWYGKGESLLGFVQELAHGVGYDLADDGSGTIRLYQAPTRQRHCSRVLVNCIGSSSAVTRIKTRRTGRNIRNTAKVVGGTNGANGAVTRYDPQSVRLYGERKITVQDPLAMSADYQSAEAGMIIRDYAWQTGDMECEHYSNFSTQVRDVIGIREPINYLAPKACSVSGYRARQEWWTLWEWTDQITRGRWSAVDTTLWPYYPVTTDAPNVQAFYSLIASPTVATITWNAITDGSVASINLYYKNGSGAFPATPAITGIDKTLTTYDLHGGSAETPWTTGDTLHVYLTTVDIYGAESIPSSIVTCQAGSAASVTGAWYDHTGYTWRVSDLSVAPNGPAELRADGKYAQEFVATFTVPSAGFTGNRLFGSRTSPATVQDWRSYDLGLFPNCNFIDVGTSSPGSTRHLYPVVVTNAPLTTGDKLYFIMQTVAKLGNFGPNSHIDDLYSNLYTLTIS